MNDNIKPRVKLLEFRELKELHGIRFSRSSLHRLESENKFPRRVPVGEHHIGWVETEIASYLAEKLAARPA